MKNLLYLFLVAALVFGLNSCEKEDKILVSNPETEFNDATIALEEVKARTEAGLELEEALKSVMTQSNEEVFYFLSRVLAGIGKKEMEFYSKTMRIVKLSKAELTNKEDDGRRDKKWFSKLCKIQPHGFGSQEDIFTFASANCF